MNRSMRKMIAVLVVAVVWTTGRGVTIRVPEDRTTINLAIIDADSGDVISVWGPPPNAPSAPPYVYHENLTVSRKAITVVNRSFTADSTCSPSWDSVVIDGRDSGSVVHIEHAIGAVVQGFTITNGRAHRGAGIFSDSCRIWILDNHVTKNHAGGIDTMGIGGGICVLFPEFEHQEIVGNLIDSNWVEGYGSRGGQGGGLYTRGGNPCIRDNRFIANTASGANSYPAAGGGAFIEIGINETLTVLGNAIEGNIASGTGSYGGGLAVSVEPNVRIAIYNNRIDGNQSYEEGAGLHLRQICPSQEPVDVTYLIAGNEVVNNGTEDHPSGGIYALSWAWPLRRNRVTGNYGWGVKLDACNVGILGTPDDPGYNVLSGDSGPELVVANMTPCYAAVNYWATVDTRTIRNRISGAGAAVSISPVAASGKWFDVEANSVCSTGVIVTGDLTVCEGVSLVIDSGRTIDFLVCPDCSSASGDPELCDLIIEGGAELQVLGGATDTTRRTVFRSREGESGSAGDWYGIRLLSEAQATLTHCDIRHAYIGVDAQSDAQLDIENSAIHDNQLCGIAWDGASATVVNDSIYGNEVYGICAANLQDGTQITGNVLLDNPTYGIMCDIYDGEGEVEIADNQVAAGTPPSTSQYGIVTRTSGDNLSVGGNSVTNYQQGGICNYHSSAPLTDNALDSNGVYGINCLSSSPSVRGNTISRHQKGVFVDNASLPDLGTQTDPGDNSILMSNTRWVESQSIVGNVYAEYNWWGTDSPDNYPRKFVGGVDYDPWLEDPPGNGEGGGQSAGRAEVLRPALEACWPNPFQSRMEFSYQLARPGPVRVAVYSADGRRLRTLEDGRFNSGRYRATWDGRDRSGRPVPAGVYLYQLETPGFRAVRKAVITR